LNKKSLEHETGLTVSGVQNTGWNENIGVKFKNRIVQAWKKGEKNESGWEQSGESYIRCSI